MDDGEFLHAMQCQDQYENHSPNKFSTICRRLCEVTEDYIKKTASINCSREIRRDMK